MPDDKTKTGKGDDSRIDVNDQSELYYWTKTLGVTAEALKKVVASVGPMVSDVKKNLGYTDKPSAGGGN